MPITYRVLDHIHLSTMPAGTYFRVFEPAFGDVLSANPHASGRLALKAGLPTDVQPAAAWYLGETQAAALWEVVLRDVAPDNDGGVWLDRRVLAKYQVQAVALAGDTPILRLDPPWRRHVIHPGSPLDARWSRLLDTPDYPATHAMAGLVQRQCAAQTPPLVLPGFAWPSRQLATARVFLLYDPPMDRNRWTPLDAPIPLDSPQGHTLLRDALSQVEMTWLDDPALSAGIVPPGAL